MNKHGNTMYEYEDFLKKVASYKTAVLENAGIYLRRVPAIQKARHFGSILWVGERKTKTWKYFIHNSISLLQAFKNWVSALKIIFK